MGVILAYFTILPSSQNFRPSENKNPWLYSGQRSIIVKITRHERSRKHFREPSPPPPPPPPAKTTMIVTVAFFKSRVRTFNCLQNLQIVSYASRCSLMKNVSLCAWQVIHITRAKSDYDRQWEIIKPPRGNMTVKSSSAASFDSIWLGWLIPRVKKLTRCHHLKYSFDGQIPCIHDTRQVNPWKNTYGSRPSNWSCTFLRGLLIPPIATKSKTTILKQKLSDDNEFCRTSIKFKQ